MNLDADFDFGILPGKRASVDVDLGPDGGVGISLPPLRRDDGDTVTTANQVIADSLSKDAPQLQGDFGHGLGFDSTEYKRGPDVNEPVVARDRYSLN